MVAALLFLPERALRNVANPFSSVMVRMSAPVCLMSPLLSHRDRKATRAGRLSKMVPITRCFFHYMVPRPQAVKAEMRRGGSEKPDYRNLWRVGEIVHKLLFCLFAGIVKNSHNHVLVAHFESATIENL